MTSPLAGVAEKLGTTNGFRTGGRLLVSLPLYHMVPASWFVRFLEVDKSPMVDVLATRKLYLAKSMQTMVAAALKAADVGRGWDRLLVWEADVLPPRDALVRIAQYPDHLDIVGGIVFQHVPPHNPIVFKQHDEDHFVALHLSQVNEMMDAPGLYPVDGIGLGFTSIHKRVLQNWDPNTFMFGGEHVLGHDMWFSREAKRQGFSIHVDTGIACHHLSEVSIGYEHAKL